MLSTDMKAKYIESVNARLRCTLLRGKSLFTKIISDNHLSNAL